MVSHHKHAKDELRDWVVMFDKRCLRSKNKETKNCMLAIRYFEFNPADQCYAPDTERPPAHIESEPAPSTRVTDASAQTDVDGAMAWSNAISSQARLLTHRLVPATVPWRTSGPCLMRRYSGGARTSGRTNTMRFRMTLAAAAPKGLKTRRRARSLLQARANWSANPRTT